MCEITLKIYGMDCAACTAYLQKNIEKEPGVTKVGVNFLSQNAVISYEKNFSLSSLVGRIEKAGYFVPEERVCLEIRKADIKEVLELESIRSIFGVKEAEILKEQGSLQLILFPVGLQEWELKKALADLGLEAEIKSWESGEEEWEQGEQLQMLRRLILSVLLSTPIFWNPPPIIQFLLATALQFFPGRYFYRGGLRAVRNRQLNMDFLIAVSTTIVYLYSSWIAFTVHSQVKLYFLCQGVLISLIFFGKYLEILVKGQTSQSLRGLMALQPKKAIVLQEGMEVEKDMEAIVINDVVLVRSGERIPVDGRILEGECIIDESMMTGESMPVHKGTGERVTGGTLNRSGIIKISVDRIGKNTALQKIIATVREAQLSKAPIQNIADRIASYFIPAVIGIALVVFIVWYFCLEKGDLEKAVMTMCGVLVVACPCALGLATPTSIMVGTGRAAELGVLFCSAVRLEQAEQSDVVVFDKTGTLTYGKIKVERICPFEGYEEKQVLHIAGELERFSTHPIAEAIFAKWKEYGIAREAWELEEVSEKPGYGLKGAYQGENYAVGNRAYMEQMGISLENLAQREDIRQAAQSEICVAHNGVIIGILGLSDEIREDAISAVEELKTMGMEVWMMTGDHEITARSIAKKVGITKVLYEADPKEKSDAIRKLKEQGKRVAMVGDGINDAPALAAADISLAMGKGSDIAKDAAGIVLLGNEVHLVPLTFTVSKKVMRNIRENFLWALVYNLICIPLAAAGIMNPSLAAAAMSFSSIAVLMHSLRLKKLCSN